MYRALCDFVDLEDNRFAYRKGDVFPRLGVNPGKERLASLQNGSNKAGKPLIEEIPDQEPKTPTKANKGRRKDK